MAEIWVNGKFYPALKITKKQINDLVIQVLKEKELITDND